MTLQQLIGSLSKQGRLDGMPQYERLHLARSLAVAVLSYHATPWLKGTWRSQDICFFGVNEHALVKGFVGLSSPHLDVTVKGSNESLSRGSTFPVSGFIRNPILFGLGVMLIEIAFMAPLQSLQRPDDEAGDSPHTEFFIAKRLVATIGREMGSNYGNIVEKCLDCNFNCVSNAGQIYDLGNPKLQTVYYRDVVCELSRLEDGFRALQLGN